MPLLPTVVSGAASNVTRRSFLQAAAGGALGSCVTQFGLANSVAPASNPSAGRAKQIIMIFLAGGPSQIDTWDPKPEAPVEYRNIDPACATSVPGLRISENLPGMAQRMHQVALVRTLSHTGPATHAAGQQLLMAGRSFYHGETAPHIGSVLSQMLSSSGDLPANVVLGGHLGNDFVADGNGQSAVWLNPRHAPYFAGVSTRPKLMAIPNKVLDQGRESWNVQRQFGFHDLGRMCLQARRLIERGTRVVTINQFGSVLDRITWDMHANGGRLNSTAADYRATLCPQLDQALCGLLDDLSDRGLLSETVVAVCGEMGRCPLINSHGGRDHHTGAWSVLLAGGPIQPGAVVGSTDAFGAVPAMRPVTPAELFATLYHSLSVDAKRIIGTGPTGIPRVILDAEPIDELF
ncbi:MAG: hypothetical protein JWN70_3550 [Planctomycetaceae bacterium]|nr:hypothetical protein [Planctomycetaceae bacterium]